MLSPRILVLPFALLCSAVAQQAQPTFRSSSELVLVPAVVTRHNESVRGLTKSDFILVHNGDREEIAVFEEIDLSTPAAGPARLPARTVQNYVPDSAHRELVILALDFTNGTWSSNKLMLAYVNDMVDELAAAGTPMALLLVTARGLSQVHSFSDAPAHAARTLQRIATVTVNNKPTLVQRDEVAATNSEASRDFASFTDPEQRELIRHNTGMFERIAQAYGGIPGRKKLIWTGRCFIACFSDFGSGTARSTFAAFDLADAVEQAGRMLSNANIAVYTVDAGAGSMPDWGSRFSPQFGGDRLESMTSFMRLLPSPLTDRPPDLLPATLQIGKMTGGQNCTDLPDKCVKRVREDGTHYYLLGFYLHGQPKPGWHKLSASVEAPGASVRTRAGFLVTENVAATESKKPEVDQDEQLQSAAGAPIDVSGVPLRLSWSEGRERDGRRRLELILSSPPGGVAVDESKGGVSLDYVAIIKPPGAGQGNTLSTAIRRTLAARDREQLQRSGFVFRSVAPLPPGEYYVRVLLRDNLTHKVGSVSTSVKITGKP